MQIYSKSCLIHFNWKTSIKPTAYKIIPCIYSLPTSLISSSFNDSDQWFMDHKLWFFHEIIAECDKCMHLRTHTNDSDFDSICSILYPSNLVQLWNNHFKIKLWATFNWTRSHSITPCWTRSSKLMIQFIIIFD